MEVFYMDLKELIKQQELERNKKKSKKRAGSPTVNLELTKIWNSNSENEWNKALERYWEFVKPENIILEKEMENLDPIKISRLNPEEFFCFLYDDYFAWKFTDKRWFESNRKHLQRYINENRLEELNRIKKELFEFDLENIKLGLEIASRIHGLGISGGSGLISLLFPKNFGTVDRVIVSNLKCIKDYVHKNSITSIDPYNIRLKDGVELIKIMKNRANELNIRNNIDKWTPRKIDQVLWAFRN
jgi:hypothetical protein